MSALALHAGVLLLRVESPTRARAAVNVSSDAASIELGLEDAAPANAPSPGGGALVADPSGEQGEAVEPVNEPPVKSEAPRAAIPVRPLPVDPAVQPGLEASDGTSDDELLASGEAREFAPAPRIKPARVRWLAARTAASDGRGTANADRGSGPGSNTGPGGNGRGFGGRLVKNAFAFGGPSGAFRADVCFIPAPVRSLKEVRECETVATFFTNALDVSPRSFTEGFPGITDRTEWFRIEYRGKFTVRAADYYKFRLLSDDGAILHIDGHRIIDNDGQHLPFSKSVTITLEPGEHDLHVSYYQGPRDNIALQLFVTQYGMPERLLGPEI